MNALNEHCVVVAEEIHTVLNGGRKINAFSWVEGQEWGECTPTIRDCGCINGKTAACCCQRCGASSRRQMGHMALLGCFCFADGPLDELCWTERMPSRMPGANWLSFASVTSERVSAFM
jgi:hypothetical protein